MQIFKLFLASHLDKIWHTIFLANRNMNVTETGQTLQHINPFLPTVPTFPIRETDVSRHNGGTSDAPLKPLRDDSALRALSSLRG